MAELTKKSVLVTYLERNKILKINSREKVVRVTWVCVGYNDFVELDRGHAIDNKDKLSAPFL